MILARTHAYDSGWIPVFQTMFQTSIKDDAELNFNDQVNEVRCV